MHVKILEQFSIKVKMVARERTGETGIYLGMCIIMITVSQLGIHCGLSSKLPVHFHNIVLPLFLQNCQSFCTADNVSSGKVVR